MSDSKKLYRGRIAPSPTGLLHVGHARTFWIAAQRAAERGGTLILRNEDLDAQRCRPEFVQAMIEDLRWLGIRWQEGPDCGGPFSPYTQSERREFYLAAWNLLREAGFVYPCSCSRKDVAMSALAPNDLDDEPVYSGNCRPAGVLPEAARLRLCGTAEAAVSTWPEALSRKGEEARLRLAGRTNASVPTQAVAKQAVPKQGVPTSAVPPQRVGVHWRFRVPDGEVISFRDLHLGVQSFVAGRDFGDFIVWRRDDVPAYQLAVVVDDAVMQITEVVRGADLLKSTARQILLFRALGLEIPEFYHCDLVRDETGMRLAKRHDSLSIRKLREMGRSAEEVRNVNIDNHEGH